MYKGSVKSLCIDVVRLKKCVHIRKVLLNWLNKADLLYNAVSHQTPSPLNKTHYYTVQSKVVDQVTHWCVSCLADRVKQAL